MYVYNTTIKAYNKNMNFVRENSPSPQKILLTMENQNYIKELRQFLKTKTGSGIFNSMLKKLPLPEVHLNLPSNTPSENIQNGSFNNTGKYSYCGPGTKIKKRLQEGYKGVNSLDKACKEHDISYSKIKSTKERNAVDDILAKRASEIALDPNEPEYVRKDARLVTGVMGMKSRFGMGLSSKNVRKSSLIRAQKN
jgi:hypothetical protein